MVAIYIFLNHKKIISQNSLAEAEVSEDICENVSPSQQFGNFKLPKH